MDVAWMQLKGAREKLKEEINAQEHIREMLVEKADRYYS